MAKLSALLAAVFLLAPSGASADTIGLSIGSSWESTPSQEGPVEAESQGSFVRLELAAPINRNTSIVPFGSWATFGASDEFVCVDCPTITDVDVYTAGISIRRSGYWGKLRVHAQGGPAYALRVVKLEGGFFPPDPGDKESGAPGVNGAVGIAVPLADTLWFGVRSHVHLERDRSILGLGLSIGY